MPQAKQIQINNKEKHNIEKREETKEEGTMKPIKTILNSQLNFLENIEKKDYSIEKLANAESSSISSENENCISEIKTTFELRKEEKSENKFQWNLPILLSEPNLYERFIIFITSLELLPNI